MKKYLVEITISKKNINEVKLPKFTNRPCTQTFDNMIPIHDFRKLSIYTQMYMTCYEK